MEAIVYNNKGAETGKVELPETIFGRKWNSDLVNQVVLSMETSKRKPVAHARDRAHVSGGGKKPWKQKGTGRARHGSTRSPIWVGGGVAHGPLNEKNFERKTNKKMRNSALFTVLSAKLRDGEIMFIDSLGVGEIKTKNAVKLLSTLSGVKGFEKIAYKKGNRAFITVPKSDAKITKSFRNIPSAFVDEMRNINPVDVLKYKYLVIENPELSLKALTARLDSARLARTNAKAK